MVLQRRFITVPINNSLSRDLLDLDGFNECFKEILNEKPEVSRYLRDLDTFSTVTYNHSVNVAMLTYSEMSKNPVFSPDEVKQWTAAALVHDAGKMKTPDEILHSEKDLTKAEAAVMMRHSIDGLTVAQDYGFDPVCTAAVIGHHINASSLDSKNYEGVEKSRFSWADDYGAAYLKDLCHEYLDFLTDSDKIALGTLSLCDQVEAMRSNERAYKAEIEWRGYDLTKEAVERVEKGEDVYAEYARQEFEQITEEMTEKDKEEEKASEFDEKYGPETIYKKTIESAVYENMVAGQLRPSLANRVYDATFKKTVDFLMKSGAAYSSRVALAEVTPSTRRFFTERKVSDILKDPRVGAEFMVKAVDKDTGQEVFAVDLGNGRYAVVPVQDPLPATDSPAELLTADDIVVMEERDGKQYYADASGSVDERSSDERKAERDESFYAEEDLPRNNPYLNRTVDLSDRVTYDKHAEEEAEDRFLY